MSLKSLGTPSRFVRKMVAIEKNVEQATFPGSPLRLLATGFALVALCALLLESSMIAAWLVRLLVE
jgi:hypothetical protein